MDTILKMFVSAIFVLMGKFKSQTPRSCENLVRILPTGVSSKNFIGARNSFWTAIKWTFLEVSKHERQIVKALRKLKQMNPRVKEVYMEK